MPTPRPGQYASREQIEELLRAGKSNSAIARHLRCDKHRVAAIRADLGLPNVPAQPLTLEEKWAAKTEPVDGGHLEWTGSRQTSSGTPVMRYREQMHTAAAIAFRIRTGRDPQGYARAECGHHHCVAPAHVDDTATRTTTREQLRYLTGRGERKPYCRHGHDQAVEGRYESDGRQYCEACKRDQRRKTTPRTPSPTSTATRSST
ncbi:helix-turn-helix domain-containing protein [Streptomyces corynorhini]|uniref:HNH endonuclease n=1 Tax=Streptomyces corynorhini TaxID=2282652 RepID=A0A370B465_9ACTN|nr:helix-turn-helix domain-containing protein [Streptomyces corynorhini]RDG35179.1 hypothetical protein DVH02_26645 [Streptomyces corynorhini]